MFVVPFSRLGSAQTSFNFGEKFVNDLPIAGKNLKLDIYKTVQESCYKVVPFDTGV